MAGSNEELRARLLAFLTSKYVQRQDARQRELGLVYMEAETHDLAETLADNFAALAPAQEPAGGGEDAEIQAYREFHLAVDSVLLGADALQIDHEGDYRAAIGNTLASIRRLATPTPQAAGVSEEMSLFDRVEFALRDAGFDYDTAFELATNATAAGAAPEGFVLVPREPTPEMRKAGRECVPYEHIPESAAQMDHAYYVYKAMLASAPQPPAQEQSA